MTSIQGLPTIAPPAAAAPPRAAAREVGGDGFVETLRGLLADLNATQVRAADAATALAAGESVGTAETVLAIEKANVTFQFAMQVRNKLLEAYQEIMRMPV